MRWNPHPEQTEMDIRRFTIGALAFLALGPAAAELTTLVEAVELTPSNVIMPGSVNGTVTFRPCAGECDKEHRRARLTPETEFYVDGKKVKFDVFLDSMAALRGDDETYALVSVDLENNTITSFRLND
jgi:hypothetical protein